LTGKVVFHIVSPYKNKLLAVRIRHRRTVTPHLNKERPMKKIMALLSVAAIRQNGDVGKAKLEEIMAKCGECHAKIRDKK
jgi:hypothetical protein